MCMKLDIKTHQVRLSREIQTFYFLLAQTQQFHFVPSCPCLCGPRTSPSRSIRLPQRPAIALAAATPIEPRLLFWADPPSANRRAAQSFWPHGWCECFMSNVMMLSRGPGLGGDTSFIPNSHGRLGLALIGPSCVGKAGSTYRLSSVEV